MADRAVQQQKDAAQRLQDAQAQRKQAETAWLEASAEWDKQQRARPVVLRQRDYLQKLRQAVPQLQHALKLKAQGEQAFAAYDTVRERMQAAEQDFRAMDAAYRKDQAGLLAETLQEGLPCPVCGATTHPAPAQRLAQTPMWPEVEAARKLLDRAQKQEREAYSQAASLQRALEEQLKAVETLVDSPVTRDTLQDVLAALAEKQQSLTDLIDRAEAAYEQSREAEAATSRRHTRSVEAEEQATRQLQAAEQAAAEALEAAAHELTAQGFEDRAQCEKSALPLERRNHYRERIDAFRTRYATLKGQEETLAAQCEGMAAVDTAPITEKLEALAQRMQALSEGEKRTYARAERMAQAAASLKRSAAEAAQANHRYQMLEDLRRTMTGTLAGSARVSFENYILQVYFGQVITAANVRLRTMSDGRFSLYGRAQSADGRSKAGLELDVFDRNTGRRREIKTLSGGESFLAALAMALGFADVVQAQHGGAVLESMFIDEGFGSLDEESLERALQVLTDLAHGNCMVGIISHVPLLRERIDNRIVVTSTREGSQAHIETL